ncbi:MAG: DUF262 domain-containing protein [Proteobacteria bacterium]|nr:DUF262 domain-containing protein [Pseudomonadota bacterium]
MSTDILVNKQSVKQLFLSGCERPFVMPEYQRPYSWTIDETEILFNDIWEFSINEGGTCSDGKYFLGSIVSYENDTGEQEIIDGQQRITTLLLLLRVIYTKLQQSEQNDAVNNFKSQIEPCIWSKDKITRQVDYSSMLVTSQVINPSIGDNVLGNILTTGQTATEATDNYSLNYNKLTELFNKKSEENPHQNINFIYALLNQVINLPIGANDQETALTIFNTLNDRGLPLTDADIFKSRLYRNSEDKISFIDRWKSLEEDSSQIEDSIQKYFILEMYHLKAEAGDIDSVSSLRKFFLADHAYRLNNPEQLLTSLRKFYDLSCVIYNNSDPNGLFDDNAIQLLNILSSYPNDFWKYPVYIYYSKYKDSCNFLNNFKLFLEKLILTLAVIWINAWGISSIKQDIHKLNVSIINSEFPEFNFSKFKNDLIKTSNYVTPHKDIVRILLKVIAYNHKKQTKVLPDKWQIEHILPQKYQTSYFPHIDKNIIEETIQHIGNLIPFERKLNIIARNNYFERKREQYKNSQIEITKTLSKLNNTDWTLDDIRKRDQEIKDTLIRIFSQWNKNYNNASHN